MNRSVYDEIINSGIVAIVRGVEKKDMVKTVDALLEGGIKCVEITFNQDSRETIKETYESLSMVNREFGDNICLGAGTVIDKDQVKQAVDAGAEYIISPNTDSEVIKYTKSLGKISIPGAFTPSEVVEAYNAGADFVKLFPAGILGTKYIKALMGPLSNIPVLAVGGVNIDNIDDFMKIGVSGVGIGGNLVDINAIKAGDFNRLAMLAKSYSSKIRR